MEDRKARRRGERALFFAGILTLCALITGCGLFNDDVSRIAIFRYVESHADGLAAFPFDDMRGNDAVRQAYIKGYLGDDTIVKDVYRHGDILVFYCGGAGIVTSSTYSGFYYVANDMPSALEFSDEAVFRETGQGKYEWKNEKGNKAFVAERIRSCWFYYHMLWS